MPSTSWNDLYTWKRAAALEHDSSENASQQPSNVWAAVEQQTPGPQPTWERHHGFCIRHAMGCE